MEAWMWYNMRSMERITENVIEEIRSRIDLADLISSYGIQVKHVGSSVKACCPFHNEKTPSFNINTAKGFYHCFGCGESGDAFKFVMKQEGLTFMEAVKKLADQCGVKLETREDPQAGKRTRLFALMAELAQFYHRCLLKMREAASARAYLEKRELDAKVQEDFLIGYAPMGISPVLTWGEKYGYSAEELAEAGVIKPSDGRPGERGYHRFGGRLMFTVRDRQGRVVAFSGRQIVEKKNSGKYVNSPETVIFKKSNVLFGFDRAAGNIAKAPHREAIVCEGQIDTIRLHICGFPVAVASQGTAFTEQHARMLKRVADAVVLVFDDDAAGHKATIRTAGLLLAEEMPVRVVSLPGGNDPDSFLRTKGAAAFQELLDHAESIVSFQCRVEQAKERDPKSIDAVARISRAVLATLSACPSAILRASMADEAAHLLGLPTVALTEELERVKREGPVVPSVAHAALSPMTVRPDAVEEAFDNLDGEPDEVEAVDEPFPDEPMTGMNAREAEPPPEREIALMEFLLANERNPKLGEMVGAFLPALVLTHAFTRAFVEAWNVELMSDTDAISAFAANLNGQERQWFERIMSRVGRTDASAQSPTDILQEFVRNLWGDHLRRIRGELPAEGDAASDMKRFQISATIKRLNMVKWHDVKDIVRQLMKGDN